jgi:hypothetical protein
MLMLFSNMASAAWVTSGLMAITQVRVTASPGGGTVYISVSSSAFCNTTVFSVDITSTSNPNGRDIYAAALAAELAGKQVAFDSTGCAGWGTPIVGIYVQP